MPKDERQIFSAVRLSGKLYGAGMEDELQADLSAAQLDRLTEKGAIAGFKGKRKAEEPPQTVETEPPVFDDAETKGEEKPKGKGK